MVKDASSVMFSHAPYISKQHVINIDYIIFCVESVSKQI